MDYWISVEVTAVTADLIWTWGKHFTCTTSINCFSKFAFAVRECYHLPKKSLSKNQRDKKHEGMVKLIWACLICFLRKGCQTWTQTFLFSISGSLEGGRGLCFRSSPVGDAVGVQNTGVVVQRLSVSLHGVHYLLLRWYVGVYEMPSGAPMSLSPSHVSTFRMAKKKKPGAELVP